MLVKLHRSFALAPVAAALLAVVAAAYPEDAGKHAPVRKASRATPDTSAHGGSATGDLFAGKIAEPITLQRAIELALRNNLEARVEHVGIRVQRAQLKFAAGAFDPVFSINSVHQSTRVPQDINNPNSAQAVASQQQLQVQLNQAAQALNAETVNVQAQAQNQASAIRQQLQNQLNASANFERAVTGQSTLQLPGIVTLNSNLIQPQQILKPNLNNFIVLDQQNDQSAASLQGRLPYGTRFQFQTSENRFRNTYSGDPSPPEPLWQSFSGITIEQPLLKSAGKDANLTDLRVARLNKKIQQYNWKQNISTAVQNVMATYFDMEAALQDMRLRQEAIEADSKLVQIYRRRLDLGFATPLDVQQSEVAVSTDREAYLAAKNIFLERQFSLKRLILDRVEANDSRVFAPERAPRLPLPAIDRGELLRTAFDRRYDYQGTLLGADVQNLRLKFAKNQLLPQLDLVGTYGFNGLDFGFARSEHQVFDGQTPQWSIGVNFQIPLGNRQPRAQYEAATAQKEQAILRIKEIELSVSVDVDTTISRIETNRQRVETSRKTRELGDEAVRISYRRLDEGLISAFDVIDQQRRLYDARSREIGVTAELNKSVTQLWLATGTVLEHEGIAFHDPVETIRVSPIGVTVHER